MNVATVQRIGPGALRATWRVKPSDADCAEFESWVESVIGPFDATINKGLATEKAAYEFWKSQ